MGYTRDAEAKPRPRHLCRAYPSIMDNIARERRTGCRHYLAGVIFHKYGVCTGTQVFQVNYTLVAVCMSDIAL